LTTVAGTSASAPTRTMSGSGWQCIAGSLRFPPVRVATLVLALAACNNSGEYSTLETTPAPTIPTSSAERVPRSTGPVEFKTDTPRRLDRFSALPLISEEEYRKTIIPLNDRLVPIRVEPADLRQPALYGFNVILDGSNRSFIIDGDEQQGYRLFVDLDGDGDLQEESPRHFIADNGLPTVVLEPTAAERGRDPDTASAPVLVFEIRAPQAHSEAPLSVWKSDQTVRRGNAKLGDGEYAFALLGNSGVYGRDYQVVFFDVDGDGKLDLTEDPLSPERYTLRERYVHLGGRGYEFRAASDGSTLVLTPLAKNRPPRPDVRPSCPAPSLRLPDFTGHMRELAEFRGKWVVLDFWTPWCQPCVRAAPELKRAELELGPRGLEIVGVHDGEPDETARNFIRDNAISGPQLIDADQAAQSLYRVDAWPAYVVIDPGGTIVTRENNWSSVRAVLDERLAHHTSMTPL
jgi:peroxiredoxin